MKISLFFLFLLLIPIATAYKIDIYGAGDIQTDKILNYLDSNNYDYTYYNMKNISVAATNQHIKTIPTIYINGIKYTDFNFSLIRHLDNITQQEIKEEQKGSNFYVYVLGVILLIILGNMIYSKYQNRFKEY